MVLLGQQPRVPGAHAEQRQPDHDEHHHAEDPVERPEVEELMRAWQEQYRELGGREEIKHVLIFENKG